MSPARPGTQEAWQAEPSTWVLQPRALFSTQKAVGWVMTETRQGQLPFSQQPLLARLGLGPRHAGPSQRLQPLLPWPPGTWSYSPHARGQRHPEPGAVGVCRGLTGQGSPDSCVFLWCSYRRKPSNRLRPSCAGRHLCPRCYATT